MLSKTIITRIRRLELKKFRRAEGMFLAEGPRLLTELLGSFRCRLLVATDAWLSRQPFSPQADEIVRVTDDELRRASLLTSPQEVLALMELPPEDPDFLAPKRELCLALDGVQDPGNVGTIVRLADWFGISHVFCSIDTADVFAPKALQATMGGVARVKVSYVDLGALIDGLDGGAPVYGTFIDGESIYAHRLSGHGLIVMGNEGRGISRTVEEKVSCRLTIPSFPPERRAVESLNVAMATAVVCSEFRRSELT